MLESWKKLPWSWSALALVPLIMSILLFGQGFADHDLEGKVLGIAFALLSAWSPRLTEELTLRLFRDTFVFQGRLTRPAQQTAAAPAVNPGPEQA